MRHVTRRPSAAAGRPATVPTTEVEVPFLEEGRILRRARQRAGMSQQFLGIMCGTTQQTVSRWEQGLGAPEPGTQQQLRGILSLPGGLWSAHATRHLAS